MSTQDRSADLRSDLLRNSSDAIVLLCVKHDELLLLSELNLTDSIGQVLERESTVLSNLKTSVRDVLLQNTRHAEHSDDTITSELEALIVELPITEAACNSLLETLHEHVSLGLITLEIACEDLEAVKDICTAGIEDGPMELADLAGRFEQYWLTEAKDFLIHLVHTKALLETLDVNLEGLARTIHRWAQSYENHLLVKTEMEMDKASTVDDRATGDGTVDEQ